MNDFPKEEFISRIEKIQIHIEKENIDAVIITSPSNFRYFTGLDSNFWESPTRPWFLIISKKNPIKAIIPSNERPLCVRGRGQYIPGNPYPAV